MIDEKVAAPCGRTGQNCMVAKHKTGMFDVMSGRICEVAADLQLLAIINRIRNDVIKCVSFEQPSHKAASIVRNVVLLS